MRQGTIGFIAQPDVGNVVPLGVVWAADNGCFNPRFFTFERWQKWLDRQQRSALWATVPDVAYDHEATVDRWERYADVVKGLGFKPAFVAQNGCTEIPDDADCLFLGGTTEWKIGPEALSLVKQAQSKGVATHMGRVNTYRRFRIAHSWGCDTADGTFLSRSPQKNVAYLVRWLHQLESETATDLLPNPGYCSGGHLLSDYVYTDKKGQRRCRECDRVRWRKKS